MNINPTNMKVVDPVQGAGDGNTQGTLKTTADNNGNSFKDLFSEFTEAKPFITTSTSSDEKSSVGTAETKGSEKSINLNFPLTLERLKQFIAKGSNTTSASKTSDSQMTDLIQQLLASIKAINNNTDTSNEKQTIGNGTANGNETQGTFSNTDALGKIGLILDMLKMNSLQGLDSDSDSGSQTSSMEELLPTLMSMLSKGDLSGTENTDGSNAGDKTSLNNVLQLMLNNLNGTSAPSGDNADGSPIAALDNSNLIELLFSKLSDVSTSTSLSDKKASITKLTQLSDLLTKMLNSVQKSGKEQDKTDLTKLEEMLASIINQMKQNGSTTNTVDQTKLNEVLKGMTDKIDLLSSNQDKADLTKLVQMLTDTDNSVKQGQSTIDETKPGEILLNLKDQNRDSSSVSDSEKGNVTEETLLKALQELNKEIRNKNNSVSDSTVTPPNTNTNATVQDIGNKLDSIIQVVTKGITNKDGKITTDDLKQAYTELVDKLQLSQLNQNTTAIQNGSNSNQPDLRVQESIGGTAVGTPVNSEQTLKNQLVNLLVLLSSEASATGNKKTDTIKKFTTLLDVAVKDKLPVEKPLITAVKEVPKGAENQDSFKAQAESTSFSKEDKILKDVAKVNTDDGKTTKVNNFIAQMSNSRADIKAESSVKEPVINRVTFNQDIIKAVKYMTTNNLKELSVKVTPEEMGEITIKLTMDQGNVKANISANTKDTFNLLNSNLNDLTNQLGTSDIKIHSLDINIYQEDTTFFNQNNDKGQQQGNSRSSRNSNSEGTDEFTAIGNEEIKVDNNISALV